MTKPADNNQISQSNKDDSDDIHTQRSMKNNAATVTRTPLWRPTLQVLINSAAVVSVLLIALFWWPGFEKPIRQALLSEPEIDTQTDSQNAHITAPIIVDTKPESTKSSTPDTSNELDISNEHIAIAAESESEATVNASPAPALQTDDKPTVLADAEYLAKQEQRITELENALKRVDNINQKLDATLDERDKLVSKITLLESQNSDAAEQLQALKSLVQDKEQQLSKQQQHIDALLKRQDELAKSPSRQQTVAKTSSQPTDLKQELENMRAEVQRRTQLLNLLAQKRSVAVQTATSNDTVDNSTHKIDATPEVKKILDATPLTPVDKPETMPDTATPMLAKLTVPPQSSVTAKLSQTNIADSASKPIPTKARVTRLAEIHFARNSTELDKTAYAKVQQALDTLKQQLPKQIKIVGFSDTIGSADHNRVLSKQRAQAVADFLINAGIAKDRIQVIGKGEDGAPKDENGVPRILPDNTIEPLNRCVGILAVNDDDVAQQALLLAAAETLAPTPSSSAKANAEMIRLAEIHFPRNGKQLDKAARDKAQRALEMLKQQLPEQIKIVGFSDTIGSADYNRVLSEQRAQAVADFLISAGIDKNRIQVIGKGEDGAPKDENGVPRILPDNTIEPLNRCVGILAVNNTHN